MEQSNDKNRIQALEKEILQRENEIQLLLETTQAIGSQLELDKVFNIIAKRARKLINSETVLIPILNLECTEYCYRAGDGANVDEIVGEVLPLDYGVCGWVWRNRKAWWSGVLDELSAEERNRWEKDAGTLIMVPLIGRQHFLGGIAGINKSNGDEFGENDLHLLELFAGQVSIAIENAMVMQKVEEAKSISYSYQTELKSLNIRLTSVNHQLEQMTLYDQLTGLPNRSLFLDRLQHELKVAQDQNLFITVMIIDIDRFQDVNEALGHEEGDNLLKEVSNRFIRALGSKDTLARLGGDEFAVLMINNSNELATKEAKVLIDILAEPILLSSQSISITAKAGIARYPEHGADVHSLLKHADAAIIAAKRVNETVHVYEGKHDDTSGRLALVQNIKNAFDNSEFKLYYQPKVELMTGRLIGVEALARWPDKNKSYIPSEMFISVMEQTGMISEFSYWVLDTAMTQRVKWVKEGNDITVAVNIPVTMILENDFVENLQRLLKKHGNVKGITLEITENIFFSGYDRLRGLMDKIQKLGLSFSIDDFGTGHSSLSRLRQLPVSELKIDKSFVIDMLKNKDDEVIVKSTIELAHNLGIRVCAEGVESSKVMNQLEKWHCDFIQGHFVSTAISVNEMNRFIKKSHWIIEKPKIGSSNQEK